MVKIWILNIGLGIRTKMGKETTYNKYKRERAELMSIISIDVQKFMLGQKDFQERLNYLTKCINLYRQQKGSHKTL